MQGNTDQKKTPYLDTFHAVYWIYSANFSLELKVKSLIIPSWIISWLARFLDHIVYLYLLCATYLWISSVKANGINKNSWSKQLFEMDLICNIMIISLLIEHVITITRQKELVILQNWLVKVKSSINKYFMFYDCTHILLNLRVFPPCWNKICQILKTIKFWKFI